MTDFPKVSIIIPTFNRRTLLEQALLSVQKQSYKNWECIIIDDFSKDGTDKLVQEFSLNDSRFKYVKKTKKMFQGAPSSRNLGLKLSQGDYIQWLDDDDLISENKLSFQVRKLESLKNKMIFTTCAWDIFWEDKILELKEVFFNCGLVKSEEIINSLVSNQTFLPSHSFLLSKKLAEKSGSWNKDLLVNQDAEYFVRVILASDGLINTNDCYVLYREHSGERISRQKSPEILKSLFQSLKLMKKNLEENGIENKKFFKWKLLLIFYKNWNNNRKILIAEKLFFKQNGIDLSMAKIYLLRYYFYKMLYPMYKNHIKLKK